MSDVSVEQLRQEVKNQAQYINQLLGVINSMSGDQKFSGLPVEVMKDLNGKETGYRMYKGASTFITSPKEIP